MYITSENVNKFHTHFAASLIYSPGKPFSVETGPGKRKEVNAIFLPPNFRHRLEVKNSMSVIIQIDPDSSLFEPFRKFPENHPYFPDPARLVKFDRKIEEIREKPGNCSHLHFLIREFVFVASGKDSVTGEKIQSLDYRVKKVIKYLKELESIPERLPVSGLAKMSDLSTDRFRHLFRKEMGLTIRRYILWLRIRKAGLLLKEGVTLTFAAHAAGFSDSAHFSKTFKENFGIPPSLVFSKNEDLHLSFCEQRF